MLVPADSDQMEIMGALTTCEAASREACLRTEKSQRVTCKRGSFTEENTPVMKYTRALGRKTSDANSDATSCEEDGQILSALASS